MYICVCKGITEENIKQAMKSPNQSVKDVMKSLGVGSDCGTCIQFAIERMMKKEMPQAAKSTK